LWPLMAIGVLIGATAHAAAWGIAPVLALLPMALAYVPRLQGSLMTFPLNQPQWSLQVELLANIAHLLILRRLRTSALLVLAAAGWVGLLLASMRTGSLQFGSTGDDWMLGFLRAGFAYPLGVALARMRAGSPHRPIAWWIAPAILLTALLVPAIPALPDALSDPVAVLLFPAVLLTAVRADLPNDIAARARWLGAISFPLYATHYPILELAHVLADDLPVAVRGPIMLVALALCVFTAHLLAKSWLASGFRLPASAAKRLQATA